MNKLQQALLNGKVVKLEKITDTDYLVLKECGGDQWVSHIYSPINDDFAIGKYQRNLENALNSFDIRVRSYKACGTVR